MALTLIGVVICSLSISSYWLYQENQKLREFYESSNPQYEDLQKLKAIRNFIGLQYNYGPENFKKNQNKAQNYVDKKIIHQIYQDLDSIDSNIQKDQVEQSSELLSIQPDLNNPLSFKLILKITNNSKSDQLILYNQITIALEKTYRSFDNPEGYWITQLNQSILSQAPEPHMSMLLEPNRLSILNVPCSVNQIENPHSKFEIKLVRGAQSEIQIRIEDSTPAQTTLDIFCDRTQFKMDVKNFNEPVEKFKVEYFKSLLMSQGLQMNRLKKVNPVANELKNDLGIIIESAD